MPPVNNKEGEEPIEEEMVNHPKHYNSHPSGVECIDIIRHFDFNLGSAVKYIWRAGLKGGEEKLVENLKKAIFHLNDEIKMIEKKQAETKKEQEQ